MTKSVSRPRSRLRRALLILLAAALLITGFFYLAQRFWAHREPQFRPDYEKVDLLPLLDGHALTGEEYETLFLQTGLGPAAIDAQLAFGELGVEVILACQEAMFDPPEEVCTPLLGWFTREDRMVDQDGQAALAPPPADLEPGDIILTLSTHSLGWHHGHAGLVLDEEHVLECAVLGTDSAVFSVRHWRNYSNYAVLRVTSADRETREEVVDYALDHLLGVPYRLTSGFWPSTKAPHPDTPGFGLHCSYLVWYAWYQMGVDLDSDGGRLASSYDLLHSDQVEVVQVFGMDPREFLP